LSLNFPFSAIM